MGVIQRQSIKSSLYNYAGVPIGFIYTSLLMPHYLEEGEIGALRLIVTYAIILSQLGSLGFNSVMIRFFPYFRDEPEQKKRFFFLGITVVLLGSLLVSGLLLAIQPIIIRSNTVESPIFTNYFNLVWPVFIFMVLFNLLDAYARSIFFSTIGSFLKEFAQRIFILAVILLVVFGWTDQQGLFWLYVAALCSPTLLLLLFLLVKKEMKLVPALPRVSKNIRREMSQVAGYSIITGFATMAVLQIDSIMVNQYFNENALGIYTIAFFFGTLVIMPQRAIQRIAPTVVAQSFKDRDLDNIGRIYHKSCLNQFAIGTLIMLGLWLNMDNILAILPENYDRGEWVIVLIGLANLINMASGMSNGILANSPYYRYNAWFVGILVVLTIISNLIFLPLMGMTGAALASMLSMLLYSLVKFGFLYKKFGYQPYDYRFVQIILFGVITFAAVSLIPASDNLYFNIILVSGLTTVLFTGMLYAGKTLPEVNQFMQRLLSKRNKN